MPVGVDRARRRLGPRKWTHLFIAVFFWGWGCSSWRVQSTHDEKASFDELETFALLAPTIEVAGKPDPARVKTFVAAIERNLEVKGYRPISADVADFHVAPLAIVKGHVEVVEFSHDYSLRPEEAWQDYSSDVYSHAHVTLVVDVVSPKTKKVLWRGWAEKQLLEKISHDELRDTVTAILEGFPP